MKESFVNTSHYAENKLKAFILIQENNFDQILKT